METISAKLKSISFRRKSTGARPVIDLKKWKLVKWLFPGAALMAACLSHIYQVSLSTVLAPLKAADTNRKLCF